ncbi:hypothetical protein K435DRAFT_776872 [Dendrothele bispora CBS 962.96]|uniref:CFA20 domain-containing protein n=1 Tax=Dendrothele bispora (strain CBS 962.96) TaxID=1314807 RepID=A0A4S8MBR0_DENBC|nr:hypothetical protein K435DRAFT_776872 [Dendrothele bispora CBS 962.96]
MFANSIQPSIVSLFSSTGSNPLSLFSSQCDTSLPSDSFIHLLDDRSSHPAPPPPAVQVHPHSSNDTHEEGGYNLDQTVLHIQSPTLPSTFIQCPPALLLQDDVGSSKDLGLKHPWIHFQVKNLGKPWSFEIGVVDQSARKGIIRSSTFQRQPHLKWSHKPDSLPLLHLPLSFPSLSSHPLTAWSTISLHLPTFLPRFSSVALTSSHAEDGDGENDISDPDSVSTMSRARLPSGTYSHIAYVRVYATCRLRRIWLNEGGPGQKPPWEFELYADG